ncbi:hypothetical protein ACFFJY_01980 [Fictibacillus aquaticus]|uniref:Uncharacterized protein n=1 Tax=Fictibacillus aquaticus TaxID=2021314 RepID=A0A235F848_9BACL|nr:hypothetical protein [Fictibacillus aquaticus]OYD57480.1 hypothetical protein CGZ90_12445 [Fictibacillus aquaticus]
MRYYINMNKSVEEEYGKAFLFDPERCKEENDEIEVLNEADPRDSGKTYIFPESFLLEISEDDYREALVSLGATEKILEKYSK